MLDMLRGLSAECAPMDKRAAHATLHLAAGDQQQLRQLLAQHIPSAQVWAYGSRVKGSHHAGSDLNLVARFAQGCYDPLRLSALKEALLACDIPIIVHILDWDGLSSARQQAIECDYLPLQTPTHA
ncbi:MAG: hypothetical protein ACRCYV_00025 [Aeromonas sp.]